MQFDINEQLLQFEVSERKYVGLMQFVHIDSLVQISHPVIKVEHDLQTPLTII